MSDISYSFSLGGLDTTRPKAPELWSFNDNVISGGPEGTAIIRRRSNDARGIVQSDLAHALSLCDEFQTLEVHAERIVAQMPALNGDLNDALSTLSSIRDAGLLESSADALKRLSDAAAPAASDPITLCVITCDRPTALERLLTSIASQGGLEHAARLLVIDDSRQQDNLARNAEICAQVASKLPVALDYVGPDARSALLSALHRALPQHSQHIDFLVERDCWPDTPTYGLARNVAMLLSVGERIVVLDDDIVFEAIAPPKALRGLSFSSISARDGALYPSADAQAQHQMPAGDSPLALMAPYIGTSVGTVTAEQLAKQGPIALTGTSGDLLARYSAQSPVLLTQTGTWGDPGTIDGSYTLYLSDGAIRTALNQNVAFDALVNARATWLGFNGPTLTPFGSMSQMTGLDNRALLPPYLPVMRSEDSVFSIMLQRMYPDSMVYNCPWAISHQPVDIRTGHEQLVPLSGKLGVSTLADWLAREPLDRDGQTVEQQLARLSHRIARLATMQQSALEELLRDSAIGRQSAQLARVLAHLRALEGTSSGAAAAPWQHFLEQSRNALVAKLQSPQPDIFDPQLTRGVLDRATLAQHGQRFADALLAWPEIRAAAQALRTETCRSD